MKACLVVLLIPILILGYATAARISVGPKDADYPQIQQALDNASEGDIIEVQSGIYHENVYIFKTVELMGIDTGKGMPLVDAGGSGSVVSIMSNGSTVQGFNVTGSGHCGCGNAGILVDSSNNSIKGNIIHNNKYGIYVRSGNSNNTFTSNDLLDNNITANDDGNSTWNVSVKLAGMKAIVGLLTGKGEQNFGNHYSDYDEPSEGCEDADGNGLCDMPRKIRAGSSVDGFASVARVNK
ncbi:MAG TPA: NosD domain-containing protein [Methanothrix sp.]|nr:NosD domain-containing protein [Methanothrix sp.]HPT20187.1 NosD domain-containing protein [Methanothrix sp.]